MKINDLVVLGRACPEPLKDGRVTVCLAGWSDALGFVRLYPTRKDMPFDQWDVVEVEVDRDDRDTRLESWKIAGSKSEWEQLGTKVKVVGKVDTADARRNIVGNLADDCVGVINDAKRSLGIVKPQILKTYFAENRKYHELFQMALPGLTEIDDTMVKRDFTHEPRIVYRCPVCQASSQQHDQQVLEWGFYEWMRKHPDEKEQVWQNAFIGRPDKDIYLLVGNQFLHRNSFMIISVLRFPKGHVTPSLFPMRKIPDN